MSAINNLSNSELRLVTRLLTTLRKDHQINLGYREPELELKLLSIVLRLDDPVVSALWNGLPASFRGGSEDTERAPADNVSSQGESRVYRGAKYQKPKARNQESEGTRTGGKYIVYRGTKQWVPD